MYVGEIVPCWGAQERTHWINLRPVEHRKRRLREISCLWSTGRPRRRWASIRSRGQSFLRKGLAQHRRRISTQGTWRCARSRLWRALCARITHARTTLERTILLQTRSCRRYIVVNAIWSSRRHCCQRNWVTAGLSPRCALRRCGQSFR